MRDVQTTDLEKIREAVFDTIDHVHRSAEEIRRQVTHSRELLVQTQETLKNAPRPLFPPAADEPV